MGITCSNSTCESTVRLDGKTTVITGCNTGIGKECAKDFYNRGAKVIMACRNLEKANEAINDIMEESEETANVGSLQVVQLDLASLKSVRKCAYKLLETEEKIDILLNNAGVMGPLLRTEEGFEMQFGTNHLGHFLFTMLLMPKIMASDSTPARIVTVSSIAHDNAVMDWADLNWNTRSYDSLLAYNQSKLANILFTNELARRLEAAGVTNVHAYSLHPGLTNSDMVRYVPDIVGKYLAELVTVFMTLFSKSVVQGAQTSIYCSVAEEVANDNGRYYKECKPARYAPNAAKVGDAKRLWTESLMLTGLDASFDPFKQ